MISLFNWETRKQNAFMCTNFLPLAIAILVKCLVIYAIISIAAKLNRY